MKPWMKVLMWLGLGGGIGFFAGYRVGAGKSYNNGYDEGYVAAKEEQVNGEAEPESALHIYRADEDDEPEMPMDPPVIGDEEELGTTSHEQQAGEDIPQLHPTQMLPQILTEEEFYENQWEYEKERLIFYAGDEVLYNPRDKVVEDVPENLIGIGTLLSFGPDEDAKFVKNDTFGTLYRIDRVEDAFYDSVEGEFSSPEDDDEEDEDNED